MTAKSQKIDPAQVPRDDLAARVQASFDRQKAMKPIGARVTKAGRTLTVCGPGSRRDAPTPVRHLHGTPGPVDEKGGGLA